jgi:hypothetical protein
MKSTPQVPETGAKGWGTSSAHAGVDMLADHAADAVRMSSAERASLLGRPESLSAAGYIWEIRIS